MDYPDIEFSLVSTESVADDVQVDRAMDGRGRARMFWTSPKSSWQVVHAAVTYDELQTLRAFYADTRGAPITIYYGCPATAYSALAVEPPQVTNLGAGLFRVTQQMTQFP